jgi:NAD(P)H dehydrogenase (quinone)
VLYAITGSTGAFGTLAVRHLLNLKIPASSLVALARDEVKAAGLKALGVQVRQADYEDPVSLEKALRGVDRLLLVSSSAVGKRFAQHKAAIDAAKTAGVKLIVYTSISRATSSANPLAPEHKATEEYLSKASVPFVLLRNNWYTENYTDDVKNAKASGSIHAAVGAGKVASASRTDYAEAAARVLIGEGHAGKVYELTGEKAWDYAELAKVAGELLGRAVTFHNQSAGDRKKTLVGFGLSEGVADFVTAIDQGIEAGTLAQTSGDLAMLLGRAPLSLKEGLTAALG